jgi:hypothetical protein
VAVLVGVVSFQLHYQIAREFADRRAFEQINVLFEADTPWYLEGFVWGSSGGSPFGGRSRVHPNVNNLVNPPLRIGATAVCAAIGCDAERLRHELALAVAPAFTGVGAAFSFLLAAGLGIPLYWALAFAGLSIASFSSLLYGSVPESYSLSGAGYAVLFFLLVRTIVGGHPAKPVVWAAVGAFLIGITTTNIVPFAMTAAAARFWHGRNLSSAALAGAKWTLAASAISLAFCLAVSAVYGELSALTAVLGQLREVSPRIVERLVEFPLSLTHTILPPLPATIDIISVVKEPYPFQLTYQGVWSPVRFGIVMGLLGWTVLALRRQGAAVRYLFAVSAATIAFNWFLHLFFGEELLLYSQHWQMPLLVLLSTLLHPHPSFRTTGRWALLALAVLAAWNDYRIMSSIMSALSSAPHA